MADIQISVRSKVAKTVGSPEIVCGNSDYAITFDFDSEWDDYTEKTARFVRYDLKAGQMRHTDVLFSGNTVIAPVLYDTSAVAVGVYAGDIHTTTPARIACARCITDGAPAHEDPAPDVYAQLLEYLAGLSPGGDSGIAVGNAVVQGIGAVAYTAGIAQTVEEE